MSVAKSDLLQKCPACNSNRPVVEKICKYCAYEFLEIVDQGLEPDQLIEKIEANLELMKKSMRKGFFRTMARNYYIVLPILAFYLMFLAVNNNKSWTLAYVFIAVSAIAIIAIMIKLVRVSLKRDLGKRPQRFRAEYEKFSRLARSYYGQKNHIQEILDSYNRELVHAENHLSRSSSRTFIISVVLVIVGTFIGIYVYQENRFISNEEYNESILTDLEMTQLSLSAEQLSGALAEYIELVPGQYQGTFQVDLTQGTRNTKFTLNNVKFRIKRNLENSKENKFLLFPSMVAEVLDSANRQVCIFKPNIGEDLLDIMSYGSNEFFLTFDELNLNDYYFDLATYEKIKTGKKFQLSTSLDKRPK